MIVSHWWECIWLTGTNVTNWTRCTSTCILGEKVELVLLFCRLSWDFPQFFLHATTKMEKRRKSIANYCLERSSIHCIRYAMTHSMKTTWEKWKQLKKREREKTENGMNECNWYRHFSRYHANIWNDNVIEVH